MKKSILLVTMLCILAIAGNASALTNVSGNITTNTTWSLANSPYLMQGNIYVEAPAELTIQAGVTVYAEEATNASLNINRGAKIHAMGTQAQPIIFTTDRVLLGNPTMARGVWGGIVLNGYSHINKCGTPQNCTDLDEYYLSNPPANTELISFGGTDDADSSGEMHYVSIRYAGHRFDAEKEWNGLSMHATGSGTVIDHLEAFMIGDDCVEHFGGTDNMKYIVGLFCDDDGFDWTEGYTGKAQFIVTRNRADVADAGQESDNWEFGFENTPRSNPTMYNITYVGDPSTLYGTGSTKGMVLRRGTAGIERNIIVTGFKGLGIDISDASTLAQGNADALNVESAIVFGNNGAGAQYDADAQALITAGQWANHANVDPKLCNAWDNGLNDACTAAGFMGTTPAACCTGLGKGNCAVKPNFAPQATSPAVNGSVVVAAPPADGFFDAVDFIGGVDPDSDWTYGWTSLGQKQLVADMDFNNIVNVQDVAKIKKMAGGLQAVQACTDINNNLVVNVQDVALAKRMATGLDASRICCTE